MDFSKIPLFTKNVVIWRCLVVPHTDDQKNIYQALLLPHDWLQENSKAICHNPLWQIGIKITTSAFKNCFFTPPSKTLYLITAPKFLSQLYELTKEFEIGSNFAFVNLDIGVENMNMIARNLALIAQRFIQSTMIETENARNKFARSMLGSKGDRKFYAWDRLVLNSMLKMLARKLKLKFN